MIFQYKVYIHPFRDFGNRIGFDKVSCIIPGIMFNGALSKGRYNLKRIFPLDLFYDIIEEM